ncbi:hypothetical protein N7474_011015 [Penicillium riverlandense]|uniref:uncharacterized protein n=1 Tax=Penicillium riverlandense TaxID=1903569 RepID=UPI0025468BB0|nr:uncharacterized protein N7474_011015 [Penicillium riverlandense]KAJ5805128.1 hypothetical protein N7474_011015 [Penicillium riverlandense]
MATVKLPEGHCVNLHPRPQQPSPYKAYRAEYNNITELSAATPSPYTPAAAGNLRRSKATKLPLPKALADKNKDPRGELHSSSSVPRPAPLSIRSASARNEGAEAESMAKDRDQYWRKIRGKNDKESPKEYNTESTNQAQKSWYQNKYETNTEDDLFVTHGASLRTDIAVSSSSNNNLARHTRTSAHRQVESETKWRKHGDLCVDAEPNDIMPQRSERIEHTTDSSGQSHPSVSPVSAEDSSMTEWEDRFVVHMPTAKDPNPPTMTAHQIAQYQQSIEKVHRSGGQMVDPDALPSPPRSSPKVKANSGAYQDQKTGPFKAYDGRPMPSLPETNQQLATPAQPQGPPGYYSPDEIGKKRFSTIWEESSPSKSKDKRSSAADGSFLGCKQINGPREQPREQPREDTILAPGEKNPDEILLFSDETSSDPQHAPPKYELKSRQIEEQNAPAAHRTVRTAEKAALQNEWAPTSRNMKHVQCSKPSSRTMCRDHSCQQHEGSRETSQNSNSNKENSHPTGHSRLPEIPDDDPRGDDVFIITPTITRTWIPTTEKKALYPKPQGIRRPSVGNGHAVTGEAMKAVRAKPQMVSTTPSGLRPAIPASLTSSTGPKMTHSQTTQLCRALPAKVDAKEKEERPPNIRQGSGGIRGFIRTSGLVKSPSDGLTSIIRTGVGSLHLPDPTRKPSSITFSAPPSRDNSDSSKSSKSFYSAKDSTPPSSIKEDHTMVHSLLRTAKVVEIAELDGQQVSNPKESIPVPKEVPKVAKEAHKPVKEAPKPVKEAAKVPKEAPKEAPKLPKEASKLSKETSRLSKEIPKPNTAQTRAEAREVRSLEKTTTREKRHSSKDKPKEKHSSRKDTSPLDTAIAVKDVKDAFNPVALSLVFELAVAIASYIHRNFRNWVDNPHVKSVLNSIMNMARHCYRVFMCIFRAVSQYQSTGSWPKPRNDQAISRFLVELLQAIVYLFVLGFGAVVIGRVAGYVVLVGSWVVWFARPFAWTVQSVGRAVF